MSDLDEKLARARDELRVAIGRRRSFDALAERSRKRTARRRVQAVAAVVVVVAVALLAVQLLPSRSEPPVASSPALPGHVVAVDFADQTQGYALLNTCPPGPNPGQECAWHVAVTVDGKSWRLASTPDLDGGSGADVVGLGGAGRAIIKQEGKRWFTGDGGQTWRPVSDPDTSTVDSIPNGAVLEANEKILAVLPESGRAVPLAAQPPVASPQPQAVPAADGSWWVYGQDPASGRPALAMSRDDGRSWTVTVPPELPGDVYQISVVRGPDALYAAAEGMSRKGPGAQRGVFLGLYRSVDGTRWDVTWRAAIEAQPLPTIAGMPVVTPGSHVLVPGRGAVLVSNNGGQTFAADGAAPPLERVTWTRGGYLNSRQGPPVRYSMSGDGVAWRDLDLP